MEGKMKASHYILIALVTLTMLLIAERVIERLDRRPIIKPIGVETIYDHRNGSEIIFRYAIDGRDCLVYLRDQDHLDEFIDYLKEVGEIR
jgi:hypothetical protein